MHTLIFFIFLVWVSFTFAKIEIAIEGKDGWAAKLPTWRLPEGHWINKFFFLNRQLTGYHLWVQIFIFSILHLVYLFVPFSLAVEFQILAFLVLFWVIEDFLWFVFNPNFGLKNFKKEKIWWHAKSWWYIAPREYFVFTILGILLYVVGILH